MAKLEIPHTIISLNVLATGRMILTTEKRVYELVSEVWTPMKFADDPEPAPEPVVPVPPVETPAAKSWSDPAPASSWTAPAPQSPAPATVIEPVPVVEPVPETHS